MSNKDKLYFKNLDSIRFFAALMVFFQHGISPCYKYLPFKNETLERILEVISNGGTGVSIFFVLSGFLITFLLITEYETHHHISLKNFYIRRLLRIWPLYFLVVLFTFLIYPFFKSLIGANNPLGSNILYHLTFLSNFDVIHVEKLGLGNSAMSQNITWSVSIEEQFYLFWPLIFVFLPRKAWGYSILSVITISMVFRIAHFKDNVVLYFHTLSVLVDLGIGGLTAYLIKRFRNVSIFFENSSTYHHLVFFALSMSLLYWNESIFCFEYGYAVSRIFISVSFALIIAAQALTKRESALNLGHISFANKWGKYTYGIYLIHPIAITLLDVAVRMLHIKSDNFIYSLLTGVAGLIFTLFLSKMSYEYYESRFLRLKEKFSA